MEFIQHTLNWVKGEIFESAIISFVGLLIVTCSVLFWKFGSTPYARSLVIPLLVAGLIPLLMGLVGVITNKNRIDSYKMAWEQDNQKFILAEKERVENFDKIFNYSYPFAFIFVITGAILFFLINSADWKAISLTMMLLGLMAYFVDHFAAERAEIYLNHIKSASIYDSSDLFSPQFFP